MPEAIHTYETLEQVLEEWRPSSVTIDDVIQPLPLRQLAALFDQPDPTLQTGYVPPLWHWLYFHEPVNQSKLGEDGHPTSNHLVPPIKQQRRMYAGGHLTWLAPLVIGDRARQTSNVESMDLKQGRSGPLLFVKVRNEVSVGSELKLIDTQNIVYRTPNDSSARSESTTSVPRNPIIPSTGCDVVLTPTEASLFRFSSLTYNAHRIHYDRRYAKDVEHYPELVVHGPLIAMLMLELPRRENPCYQPSAFEFRAMRPVYVLQQVWARGRETGNSGDLELSAGVNEHVCFTATLSLALVAGEGGGT